MGPDHPRLTWVDNSIVPGFYPRTSVARGSRVGGSSSSSPADTRRPQECPICHKEVKKDLNRHINLHREENQERVFCPYAEEEGCPKSVAKGQLCNLYTHIRRDHTDEFLYCTLCKFKTYDNTYMSRHWKKKHKGEDKPQWPRPKMPSVMANTSSVGSSSTSSSPYVQQSPLPSVSSDYESPPPSSASSSSSSVYGTPYSPVHPPTVTHSTFRPPPTEDDISMVVDIASTNLPATTTHHACPQLVSAQPLFLHPSDMVLSTFDSTAHRAIYGNSGDKFNLQGNVSSMPPHFQQRVHGIDPSFSMSRHGISCTNAFVANRGGSNHIGQVFNAVPSSTSTFLGSHGSHQDIRLSRGNFAPTSSYRENPPPPALDSSTGDEELTPNPLDLLLDVHEFLSKPSGYSPPIKSPHTSSSSSYDRPGSAFYPRNSVVVSRVPPLPVNTQPNGGWPRPAAFLPSFSSGFGTSSTATYSQNAY
ncbi:hypothetical protein DL96DRAFT_1558174 [Flagelloscypha sp. PMI_526]|nr:hypothetical protein DL96DRAFT_1558174 [Flagelloscypha sp. PMI_526]